MSEWKATTYTDPRMHARIYDWPIGRDQRWTAVFEVECHPKKGERVSRTTIGKPVKTTFGWKARIVTGDDGRIYIATLGMYSRMISIMRGDMKYSHAVLSETDNATKQAHADAMRLFED